ncbi:MAG: 3-hydroxyacyl-CoA dehydrogenase [Gammaproteobacteria bacterium]|nr:MAG: 3-hydroxyacyl-CoA dehydrogenase [Gammaproteobacteria bacterium]
MTNIIKFECDQDGVALLTIDCPDKSMNVISTELMADLETVVAKISDDDSIKGAVLTSGKKGSFLAGADLNMILDLAKSVNKNAVEDSFEQISRLSKALRNLETCGKPVAVAINGLALGGGMEICLACHYRVVADNPKINLGFPEVMVGLLPGAGGTQRLPRLMGVQAALPYLLQGKNMNPEKALANNVVDEIAPAEQIISKAKAWVLSEGNATQPWDEKRFKVPGGQGAFNPKIAQTFMGGQAMLQKESKGNYPAPVAIMSCVYEGHQLPIDTALKIECQYFTELLLDDVASNMIRTLFINKQAAEKGIRRPKGIPPMKTSKLGMLGAGMMGAGIAYVSAMAGIEVILLDVSMDAAVKGKSYSDALLAKRVSRNKMSQEKADSILSLIKPTTDYADLEGCDLIIEAVLEDMAVKADVTAKVEAVVPDACIFGSNTSTLPITQLAKASKREQQFIGIHFFSPVDKMPLVEIIVGEQTGDEAIARALDYAAQIRKTPIVVNDGRGFYTSRCFGSYPKEAMNMLAEGIAPALIDNSGAFAGMAVGPLTVADEVSIELMHHVGEATRKAIGEEYKMEKCDDVINKMVVSLERVGRKSSKGFYDYNEDGNKTFWPGLSEHYPLLEDQPTQEEVTQRLMYRQALEVVRCLEEKVLSAPEDADIGAIFGWGFAPWTGGPLSMIDTIGIEKFIARCDRFADKYGSAFQVPDLLRDMSEKNQSFYC